MADFVFNIAKGRVVEFYNRVENNDPSTSAFIIMVINAGGATDTTLKRLDSFLDIENDANAAEVTNSNYGRKTLTDTELASLPSPDDSNDRYDIDIPDQTWSAVSAGDAWTDLIVGYDADTGGGTDANVIPCTQHDFAVTPDGSDITAQIAAAGFFRAS